MVHQYDDAGMSSSRDVVLAHILRCHQWLVGMVPILLSTTLLVLRTMCSGDTHQHTVLQVLHCTGMYHPR